MEEISTALNLVVSGLSGENYTQSLDFFRFWFDIGQTYHQTPSDQIFNAIWSNRAMGLTMDFSRKELTRAAHLILRFASDAESDDILAPHSSGLQNRLCTRAVREFFTNNLMAVRGYSESQDYAGANLMAHWANLGYVEEAAIRNHILQSYLLPNAARSPSLHAHHSVRSGGRHI